MAETIEADQPQGDGLEAQSPTRITRWVNEITLYDRETDTWDKKSKRIIERYKDSRNTAKDGVDSSTATRFNVLWSNTQTLLPAIYAKNPKPDIQRRFKDADPVGRVTSDILERCATYFCDNDLFSNMMRQCSLDYLLPGRGTNWVRYVPHMRTEGAGEITDDVVEGEDQKPEPLELVAYEEAVPDYVHRADFGHNICRTWDEVWCVWRKVYLTREQLIKRFGKDQGMLPPLDHRDKTLKDQTLDDGVSKSTIYELWDKDRKEAVWFHKDIPNSLDLRPDPLELDGFFPCPKPMFTNLANDSLIPVPDFIEYQDQAIELDSLTARISSITKSLKVAGIYDASAQGISRLLSEGTENQLIPVEQWALMQEKGGLEGSFALFPLEKIAQTLTELYAVREQVKKDLYEITGISDLVRGQSEASESATAQQIKSNFATMRIGDKQKEVQRFARETIRLIVDVICGHFQLDTIKKISGVRLFTKDEKAAIKQYQQIMAQQPPAQPGAPPSAPLTPPPPVLQGLTQDQIENMMADPSWEEVDALIRDDAMRCFRIDIETDSTIKADEDAEKQSRVEFLKAIGEFMSNALPAGQQHPELVPFLIASLQFLARGFPVGKEMENALNIACQKLEKAAQNPQQKPDPEMVKIQGQLQLQQAEMQGKQQMAQQQAQLDAQAAQAKAQADAQVEQAKAQAQAATQQHLNQLEDQRRRDEMAGELQIQREKMAMERDLELQKAHIQAAASIEVARINAKADDGAAAEAREAGGE